MNPLQEMVLIGEVYLQSKIALRASTQLKSETEDFDRVDTWSHIQTFLIASANVSKILWPVRIQSKGRGKLLRLKLNVKSDNPLKNRYFRNYFEHYDEQVEDWFANTKSSVYVDLAMNPSINGFLGNSVNTHRGYNSFNHTLVFRSETLNLMLLDEALTQLCENCKQFVLLI
jgi:hypothetical protein